MDASMVSTFGGALASGLGTMVTDATSQIGSIAPVALPIFAGVIGIGILFKVARKMAKA